jgi:hypothetical protein
MVAMTDTQRVFFRLRQRALRCYELLLYALVLALAGGVALAGSSAQRPDDAVQCGSAHSSTGVITR